MKKNILLVAIALLIFSIPAFAQKATRVTFKRGATSATISGSLNSYKSKRVFLLKVRDGQTLTIQTVKGGVSVYVEVPPGAVEQDLAADCHGDSEITPTTAGDYKISVVECQKVDQWKGTFKVKVTVK